jgi:hypothetical protein
MKTTITDCSRFGKISKALLLFFVAGLFAFSANAQSLATDQPDYAPNSTATISGFGFNAGETVTMQVTYADGSPLSAPYSNSWVVTADANGNFTTTWLVCYCPWASLVATANGNQGSYADVYFTDSGIDFNQASNQCHGTIVPNATCPVVNPPLSWINGILNPNNSDYTEGIGVPQRIILFDIPATPGNVHTLTLSHQAVKGGIHAYDFLMSWAQAVQTAANIMNNPVNELQDLFAQKCDAAISSGALQACTTAVNHLAVTVPDVMGQPTTLTDPQPPVNTIDQAIACFEGIYGDRVVDIYGNAPVTAGTLTFTGYNEGQNDAYAEYTLTWTSASTQIVILMAGRSAQSCTSPACCGYGPGHGSGSVNGGPYHFKLFQLDGASLGSQDNQLQASALAPAPTCADVLISGPNNVCPNSTGNQYSATITPGMCSSPTHSWSITGNGTIVGSTTGSSITVTAGSTCGTFTICDTIRCDEGEVICCQTFTVFDNTPPTFTFCPPGSDLGCNPSGVPAPGAATATDNCDVNLTITSSLGAIGGTPCARTQTRTYTATDDCGISSTCTQTFTWVDDLTGPVFTFCPPGSDLGCNPSGVPAAGAATATDNCDQNVSITSSLGSVSGPACARSQTRTYTATDDCNNSTTCTQTFTWVDDLTGPVFTFCPPGSNLGCNPGGVPAAGAATATDNCDQNVSITSSLGSITGPSCSRSQTRTYTATDDCNNSTTCTQTFTWVDDLTGPVFTFCPPGSDLGCNPGGVPGPGAATATDDCGTANITSSLGSVSGPACARSQTRTYTATDGCGNTSTCTQTFTWVDDLTGPVFTFCPPGSDLGCNPGGVPAAGAATATDNCDQNVSITSSLGSVSGPACARSQTRTYTATDDCNNSTTCTQTFTWVDDLTGPVFTFCPPGSNLGCNPGGVPAAGAATATDNCDQNVSITSSLGSVSGPACARSQTRTYTATDDCNNSATCTQTFTWVDDLTGPVFTFCPPGSDLGCNPGGVPAAGAATATDNCDQNVSITSSLGSVSGPACARSQTRTYTATDDCNNSTTCTQTFTWVDDNNAPVFNCPSDATIGCNDPVVFGTATATDDCTQNPSVVITQSDVVTNNPDGSVSHCRTWQATDDCSNTSNCTQCITVNPCSDLHCTRTQGYWGNSNGQLCTGQTSDQAKLALLSPPFGNMVIGCAGGMLTLTAADVACITARMPAGGPDAVITGNNTCNSIVGISLMNNGRFRNNFLGQLIAMEFNVRMDTSLLSLQLGGQYLTVQGASGCDTSAVPVGSPITYSLSPVLLNYLGANNTIADLLALANQAICGAYVPSPGNPTLGDIKGALDKLNNAFDECTFVVGFSNTLRDGQLVTTSTPGSFSMMAYPNPFNSQTSIEFTPDMTTDNLKVEIFNTAGAQVAVLFNGPVQEGSTYKVDFDGANYPAGVYIYRISTESQSYFDKLVLVK